jgi:hypothetical protein
VTTDLVGSEELLALVGNRLLEVRHDFDAVRIRGERAPADVRY